MPLQAGSAGDPVETYTGNYFSSVVDLVLPGTTPRLLFVRAYNSLDTRVTPLGPGWSFNYHARINNPGDGTLDLLVVGPEGRTDRYTHTPDGNYVPPPAVHAALQHNVDNTYTLTLPDGGNQLFDGNGGLRQITDAQGHQTDLDYDQQLRLVAVRGAVSGAGFTLAYDQSGERLSKVSATAAPGRVVQYAYDAAGRLSSVIAADGTITRYTYVSSSQQLNAVFDGQDTPVLTLTYDGQGRVVTQREGEGIRTGQQTTFAYVDQPGGGRVTTITYPPDPAGSTWRPIMQDSYDSLGRLVQRVDRPTATRTITEHRTYDPNFDLLSRTVEVTDATPPAPATCQFVLGFRTLHNLAPAQVGECLDNEQHVSNGDALQHTTKGLLDWRAADNWTAFTDGYETWINGPTGLVHRLNTQRFSWEANPQHLPVVAQHS